MAGKRKRKTRISDLTINEKRQKIGHPAQSYNAIKSALLNQFYPAVVTLREYLLRRLPQSSKIRKRKIRDIGKKTAEDNQFAIFLDEALIGVTKESQNATTDRWKQFTTFSQRPDESTSTLANLTGVGKFSQSEVVDFAIWQLFSRNHNGKSLNHLLCQGFRRELNAGDDDGHCAIPGITSTYPNSHVTALKAMPWPRILTLMGNEGEKAMIDLLLDCSIFTPITGSHGSYSQLSGQPLGEMKTKVMTSVGEDIGVAGQVQRSLRSPLEITFVRNRMLYARAALNACGEIRFGLRHIHILNRSKPTKHAVESPRNGPKREANDSALRIMLYMFPRQFGLHNVFTSEVDTRQTVQPFQDYTLREDEISSTFSKIPKIPRRLRGKLLELVEKLQVRHTRCSYKELLDYHCPIESSRYTAMPPRPGTSDMTGENHRTQLRATKGNVTSNNASCSKRTPLILPTKPSLMDHATPSSHIGAFCVAALFRLVPKEFWGSGEDQEHNLKIVKDNISKFVHERRFESLTLHEVIQGIKISNMTWLGPPTKMSQSDAKKRWEILHEFIYYFFDSLLIPLIRSNFHVTESNVHRYRLFYFRHDVWKSLADPALNTLKLSMFQELSLQQASRIFDRRKLGYSQIRLLPKEKGIRPIMNLRRRMVKQGTKYLGSSINSILAPVHNVLSYEKTTHPDRLGASSFSVGDLYSRLKNFKFRLPEAQRLFFAKLDVQAAFDTIPQAAVIELMHSLASEEEYRISKHMEMKPGEDFRNHPDSKPGRKWIAKAHAPDDLDTFDEALEGCLAKEKRNTIFVENIVGKFHDAKDIFNRLEEHVKNNIVKIGKRFYRQKLGIPQGSVISSHLCNYFYADLEKKFLGFLDPKESLLLRLIDDFLLITINPVHAKRFLQIMHDGVPAYGVCVNPDKTLVNFEVSISGKKVPRVVATNAFPYCGSFIDTKTLDLRRDRERNKNTTLSDSLTVEYSKNPGHSFHRKVLNAFKIQSHAMFIDTSFNGLSTVLFNLYTAFVETARKAWGYVKCLPSGKGPSTALYIRMITDLSNLAFVLCKSKARNRKNVGFVFGVRKAQVEWLVLNAFHKVLLQKQSRYRKVIEWLEETMEGIKGREGEMCRRLNGVIVAGEGGEEGEE